MLRFAPSTFRRRLTLWCLGIVLGALTSELRADEAIAILPGSLKLTGAAARHRLLVEKTRDGRAIGQLTEGIRFETSDPRIVKIESGVAVPVANGAAVITAHAPQGDATVPVEVAEMETSHEWSFRNHVESVMAKTGCNSGACHGALVGKGGFKLSLRGYDVETDYQTITKQARGRRIELSDPGRSLVIAKPSGAIPHKGGLRFETDSLDYQVFSQWIAQGAQPPRDDDPRLVKLEILPATFSLTQKAQQQVLVRAHFSDGHAEDVTQWAKYNSTNEAVSQVDDNGKVTVIGHGEGAIVAWYMSNIVIARVTAPYSHTVPADVFVNAERRNFIDELVLEKLKGLNLSPSPAAGDAEFLRRVSLDTIGILPTADEVRAFLSDESPDKRDRLIEALLARPEFVDYWSYKWSDLLLVSGKLLRPNALNAYYKWIRSAVAANLPWDQFAREVVTSKGSSYENGATNFYALHQDPQEMSEHTSMAFLGLSINCARCHNHPLEKWTNNQYYSMANLFARVRAKGWGGDVNGGDGLRTVYVATEGDLIQPLTGRAQPPAPLDGEPIVADSPEDRRIHLAKWLTSSENPYFTRSITNRVWANFMGVGLVEAVDDLRASNPASNEDLLTALARHVVENHYDLKALMRLIMQSKTYQRTSHPLPENKDELRFYSRYYPRRLMAEVMLDAISQVSGSPTKFQSQPDGTRAMQLADSNVDSYFLKTFGRPERVITCECERSAQPTMVQVMHISNGDTINQKLQAKDNRIAKLLAENVPDATIIDEAFLSALGREPTESEKTRLLAVLAESTSVEKRLLIEDLYWGILSSKEFLFNH